MSAFQTLGGVADVVLHLGLEEAFTRCLADEIIAETVRRLLSPRLQQRYAYTTDEVDTFKATLRGAFLIISDLPPLRGIVRDPNDDMVLACAVAADASHVVTRDNDLLSLQTYEGITIMTPESFLTMLRGNE